jgi:hypothetical protein
MIGKFQVVLLLAASSTVALRAQEVSAGITGRVADQSGSSIVKARISAKDLDRGDDWPTTTNDDGIYAFPRIPPGRYELRIEATGFKTYINPEVALEVNQRARVDVRMEVGAITESVEVKGEAPLLQTDTTQVGAVISSKTIEDMPLISRNPIALTLLTAGVTTPDPNSFNSGLRSAGGGRPYVNGNREESNNFLLDGIDNNFTSDNLVSYQPNPDALEEFKLITNNASAEFGNFQGGIVNMVIKSGTNQFHGDVFEYFRNDVLNANNWGRNWQGLPKPPLRWNQFGATGGGRIVKDKLFFFADYQGLRQANPTSLTSATVMPTAWRNGDFSSLLNASGPNSVGKVIQLYNPYSVDPTTSLRAPFPGNIIPQSLLSPAAVKLMSNTSLYPNPQTTTISTPNYTYSSASYITSDQGDFKLDWKPRDNDYLSFRYSHGMQNNPGVNSFPLFYNSFNQSPFQNQVIDWTHTFGPRMVNEARFGVNNVLLDNGGADKGLGNIALNAGIANAGAGLLSLQGFTYVSAVGNENIGVQQLFANTTWHYADNVTLIRGRHQMKMGIQALREWINVFYSGNNGRSGYINFNGKFTGQNALNPTVTLGEADFMMGLPDDLGRGLQSGTWGQRSTVWATYFQDDWRATNNLTLNLGLRWEYHTPWLEVDNRQSNFNEFTGQLELAAPLPAGLAAPPGPAPLIESNRALYNTFKKDFQPRIGFAFTPDMLQKKLVLRGSYTISSYLEGTGTNLRLPLNPPYEQEFESNYNIAGAAYEMPGSTLDQGLSQISAKNPYAGATIRLWDPFVRPADVQQWNVTSEYEFKGGNVLTVGYVGQHGDHLMVAMPYFQNEIVNGAVVPGPYLAGNPTLRAEIGQISGTCSCAKQKYNALQATLHKRFGMGLTYQVAFTYSRGMSDSIGYYGQGAQAGSQSAYWQNLFNQQSEFGPTYFDEKFNFVPSVVYELPFGRGRKYGSAWNKAVDGMFGGWQLGSIYTAHTGFPLTIKLASDPSGTGARSYRANVVGTPHDPHQVGPGNTWLDVTAYATPALHTFGNSGVGVVRGPGESRLDLSIAKQFHVTEKKYFELRGEAFGVTNTPIFYSPASQTITSTLFGQIRSSEGERNMQVAMKFYF